MILKVWGDFPLISIRIWKTPLNFRVNSGFTYNPNFRVDSPPLSMGMQMLNVITIVAMFTIVAINHNCCNIINHKCCNSNHHCRNFSKIFGLVNVYRRN